MSLVILLEVPLVLLKPHSDVVFQPPLRNFAGTTPSTWVRSSLPACAHDALGFQFLGVEVHVEFRLSPVVIEGQIGQAGNGLQFFLHLGGDIRKSL